MAKSIFQSGNAVFGQLLSLVFPDIVEKAARQQQADRYVKKFDTFTHLSCMLFAVFSKCNSLRELSSAFLSLKSKSSHLRLRTLPKRSTLSDANRRRSASVFEEIFYQLLRRYASILSDSQYRLDIQQFRKQVRLIDSTIITVAQSLLGAIGRCDKNGKRKGGIKVHVELPMEVPVPEVVYFTSVTTHDHRFLEQIKMEKDRVYVFDRGYNDYALFHQLTKEGIGFVTRLKDNAVYKSVEELDILEDVDPGVIKDEKIEVTYKEQESKEIKTVQLRRIAYWDEKEQRLIVFLTNWMDIRADVVSALYQKRWQIELFFKRIKQNFPLKYLLGENENAIKIQIWCVLIANLLLEVVRRRVKKHRWSFSNLVSFCRIQLLSYIDLMVFLNEPNKDWEREIKQRGVLQLSLFDG